MGKRVWIVNPQTGSPDKAANPRYLELAKYFMEAGYDVTTFNSSQREGIDIPNGKYLEKQYGDYKFVHVCAPEFVGNGVKRMLSLHKFAKNVYSIRKDFEKPDVILQNIHPPFDYPIVRMARKLKAKYIAEAWDLWPQAFVTYGLVSAKNPLMKLAYSIEKRYYYNADEIVFTFLGAFEYLKRHGWMKEQGGRIDPAHLHYINNGIDLEKFNQDRIEHPRPDADMNDNGLYRIVYLGTINRVNNVKTLIDAANLLQNNPKYMFFIYGDGADRDKLEHYIADNNIKNVVFKEHRIKYEECAWVVSQATVNIMNYHPGFGQWGVSSGKMFQYLAAGKPIVCNINIGYDNVIKDNNLGVSRIMNTPEEFAESIRSIAEQPKEEYEAMCKRVREVAKRFDYKVLAAREIELLG